LRSKLEETENQHGNQCCPNLDLDGIGTGSHKGLDLKVLLQGFKEDLNLPTLFVDGSNGCGPQFQIAGQKHQDLLCLGIIDLDPSKRVIGPPKMPKDITDKLTKALETAANDPGYQKFLLERSSTPFYLPPEKIVLHLDGQRKVARNIMEKAGILKEK